MKVTKKVLFWILAVFLAIGGLTYIPNIGGFLLLLSAIMLVPIGKLQELINGAFGSAFKKSKKPQRIKGWIIALVAFLGFAFSGESTEPSETPDSIPISIEQSVDETHSPEVEDSTTEIVSSPTPAPSATPAPTPTPTPIPTPAPTESVTITPTNTNPANSNPVSLASIPAFSGNPYVAVNGNQPNFQEADLSTVSYEYYSALDSLGRCGYTVACIGQDIMPTEERGAIGQVKPTGWHTVKYDIVDGKYLYNRCHLIGFQLTGENANTKNLITGTRYMNVDGMLPFENMVADYVQETGNHVMYRVTPIFDGNNLLASGVQMEAYSVEDQGDGICFNVFVYNAQPGIYINYKTGESSLAEEAPSETPDAQPTEVPTPTPTPTPDQTPTPTPTPNPTPTPTPEPTGKNYTANTNTHKFHYPSCSSAGKINPENRWDYYGTREYLISIGYSPCGNCHP